MVFLGSNLSDDSSPAVKNLPLLLAGGDFRRGQHLAFDSQNPPVNLYVNVPQRLRIETARFSSRMGTLTGLAAG